MRKTKSFIYVLFLMITLGCTNSNKSLKTTSSKPSICVTVNEQMELVRIAWNLAWQSEIEEDEKTTPSTYSVSVEKHFNQWAEHELVRFMIENEIYDYSFPSIGLYLDTNFSVIHPKGIKKWEDIYGKKVISEFLKQLKKFADDTKSESFFKTKKKETTLFCEDLRLKIDSTNWLKNYTNVFPEINKVKQIFIYVDALNNIGNTEVTIDDQNIGILYPYYSDNPVELQSKPIKPVCINIIEGEITFYHELSHFMTTGMTHKYYPSIQPNIQCYFSTPPSTNTSKYYKNQLDETIVRAYSIFVWSKTSHGKDKIVNSCLNSQAKEYKMIKKVFDLIEQCDHQFPNSAVMRHELLLKKLVGMGC